MTSLPPHKLRIGRALLAGGPLTLELLQRELQESHKNDSVLGKALLQSGFPSEEKLIAQLLQKLRIPKINARNTKIPLETVRLLPADIAKRCRILPIDQIGSVLVVVTPDIGNEEAIAEVRHSWSKVAEKLPSAGKRSGWFVTPIQCSSEGFDQIVNDYYQRLADAGMQPIAATDREAQGVSAGPANGAVSAIPTGPDNEDSFYKRYMTSGPIPAQEILM